MGANELVMQRLNDTLAQLHTEMVLQRQQRQRALADARQYVSEYGFINNATQGNPITVNQLMTSPVLIKRFLCYASTAHLVLVIDPNNGFQIPLNAGITTITCETLFKAGDRPYLVDNTGGANAYLRLFGWQLPSEAQPL